MPSKRIDPKTLKGRTGLFVSAVIKWEQENPRNLPWRENRTPYSVLIAEILIKRTSPAGIKDRYRDFLSRYPNIATLAKAKRQDLEQVLVSLGLKIQRGSALTDLARFVVERMAGEIPDSYTELRYLPMIGQYSAGPILSFGHGKPWPVIDVSVLRVIGRAFGDELDHRVTDKRVTEFLKPLIPESGHEFFNWGLSDLGANICSSKFINCRKCPVTVYCDYWFNTKGGRTHRGA